VGESGRASVDQFLREIKSRPRRLLKAVINDRITNTHYTFNSICTYFRIS
jgi:hypothetical protein